MLESTNQPLILALKQPGFLQAFGVVFQHLFIPELNLTLFGLCWTQQRVEICVDC